jgi:hypothetical protein
VHEPTQLSPRNYKPELKKLLPRLCGEPLAIS